jgi:acetyltransferase-like isoleucine patch superfamily enzyme
MTLRKIFKEYHHIEIGLYSYGLFSVDLSLGTVVGRYTSVADGLVVIHGSHPIKHKSTHPFFFNPDCGFVNQRLNLRRTKLIIGHDVYIGLNVTILPSAQQIGDGAVIAARSVVVKDVPPYAIVGGNPAKLIRYRFAPEVIDKIQASRWWEKDIKELSADEQKFEGFLKDFT